VCTGRWAAQSSVMLCCVVPVAVLLYGADAVLQPGIGHAQSGLVGQVDVRDAVADVGGVAGQHAVRVLLLWYLGPTEKELSCSGRGGFRLVEKTAVEYVQR
jgi:hypothetical protein